MSRPRQGGIIAPLWGIALGVVALLMSSVTLAHDVRPATLSLIELEDGRVSVAWTPPISTAGPDSQIEPVYPGHCVERSARELDCGTAGLSGELRIAGLAGKSAQVVVQVERADGSAQVAALRDGQETLRLGIGTGGAKLQLAWTYTVIGVEHIVLGIDHVLFVLGLLFVVGFERRLVATITAFTVAHSITLGCSVLGLVALPIAPVEAVIALSILLVASEACHERPTLTRRAPWAVAFAFGLLHGFGFAGALQEIGLPPDQLPLSLACFNVGVELGQLGIVGLAYLGYRLVRDRPRIAAALRRPALYLMGTAAAFWAIERILLVFGVSRPG